MHVDLLDVVEMFCMTCRYHLKDVIVGKIYFLLVRIKIKHMELQVIKRETTGTGIFLKIVVGVGGTLSYGCICQGLLIESVISMAQLLCSTVLLSLYLTVSMVHMANCDYPFFPYSML